MDEDKKTLRERIAEMPVGQKVMVGVASTLVVGGAVALYLRHRATEETVRGLIENSVS
jgi:hypothetical protein